MWKKFIAWWRGPKCTECGINWPTNNLFVGDGWCIKCWEEDFSQQCKISRENEREQRINEQAEALRRAFPNGPYR